MIKAICETYHRKEHREQLFFADPIKGKGEGLIILLHGPPGTGKTLTAGIYADDQTVEKVIDVALRIGS